MRHYVSGDSEEEIDASIAKAKETSANILAGIQRARADQYAGFVREGIGDQVPDVSGMNMAEYARNRGKLGVTGRVDHGLLGPIV